MLLTAFKVSGSSIGIYSDIFYGSGHKDNNLLLNKPRPIRSDEWVWNSQMIMAQEANHYERVNPNLGHGQDMSLIIDVPYKDWSAIFRPQNLAFFILPFQNAFAFKWWFLGYLLVLAGYFFVLYLLPKKRLLAATIALTLLFSPFVQWWYQYITLAPIYYSLFSLLIFMHLLKTSDLRTKLLHGLALAYLLTCFALVLYPPFQVASALVALVFALGYLANHFRAVDKKAFIKDLAILGASAVLGGLLVLAFIFSRADSVKKIQNTAYPGKRIVNSGGYNFDHLFSGHLDFQLQFFSKADKYQLPKQGLTNQSEDSNFVLILPFLLLPSVYLILRGHRAREELDWLLLLLNTAFIGLVIWLFIPHLTLISKLTLLSKVPQNRLIIGLGLLNFLALVAFIRCLSRQKIDIFTKWPAIIYSGFIFIVELLLGLHAKHDFPGYIGTYRAIAFALPVPVIVYFLLRRRYEWAALGLLAFCLFMTIGVHPLYRGTNIITDTPLSQDIRYIAAKDHGNWAVEDSYLENFAFLNGAHSLSGIYTVPQLDIWDKVKGADPDIYNRYAHVNFTFDRNPAANINTQISLGGGDHFGVTTEPCGDFLKNNKVHFLLTSVPFNPSIGCVKLVEKVAYPAKTAYIYRLD
ncbi:hypothetical protein KW801_00790 [Candidatus Saccharibacteria bacterium]|nr:hypothetical protein [Candidatus Saccharibacteria bacterium]